MTDDVYQLPLAFSILYKLTTYGTDKKCLLKLKFSIRISDKL